MSWLNSRTAILLSVHSLTDAKTTGNADRRCKMRTSLLTPSQICFVLSLPHWALAPVDCLGERSLRAFWGGLMGALAGLIAMVMIWRRSLLRRKRVVWNALAKLSYLLVLTAFVGAAAGIGAVRTVQGNFKSMLTEEMKPALTARMPTVREYLASRISKFAPDKRSAKDLLTILMNELRYTPANDTVWENLKANCVNWLIRKFGTELFVEQFQKLVIIKLEALGGAMKIDMYGRAQGQLVRATWCGYVSQARH
jgi:hypothetical protein